VIPDLKVSKVLKVILDLRVILVPKALKAFKAILDLRDHKV
jgi:hypothetical protein